MATVRITSVGDKKPDRAALCCPPASVWSAGAISAGGKMWEYDVDSDEDYSLIEQKRFSIWFKYLDNTTGFISLPPYTNTMDFKINNSAVVKVQGVKSIWTN